MQHQSEWLLKRCIICTCQRMRKTEHVKSEVI